jgi:phosphotransacetylase
MFSALEEIRQRAASLSKRIIYVGPEGKHLPEAVGRISRTGLANPILLAPREGIGARPSAQPLSGDVQVVGMEAEKLDHYARLLMEDCRARGFGELEIREKLKEAEVYAVAMIRAGEADALILGPGSAARGGLDPVVQLRDGKKLPWRSYLVAWPDGSPSRNLLFADVAGHVAADPSELAEIGLEAVELTRSLLKSPPSVAFLAPRVIAELKRPSKLNSATFRLRRRVEEAVATLQARQESLAVDSAIHSWLPSSSTAKGPNTYIFADPQLGNVASQLRRACTGSRVLGEVLLGFGQPTGCLEADATVDDILDITAFTALS